MNETKETLEENNIDPRYLTMLTGYEDILEIKEVGRILRLDPKTVSAKIRHGELKCMKFGRTIRIPKIWVIEYIIKLGEIQNCNAKELSEKEVLKFCCTPRSRREIQLHMGYRDKNSIKSSWINPLVESGNLKMLYPTNPHHIKQKYISTGREDEPNVTSESL